MKKFILFFLLLTCVLPLFASEDINLAPYESVVKENYVPTSSIGSLPLQYAVSQNPSSLVNSGLIIQFPHVTATVYHLSKVMQNPKAAEAISRLTKFNYSNAKKDILLILASLLEVAGRGHSYIAIVDAGFGVAAKGLGLSVDAQVAVHSMPKIVNKETGELYDGILNLTTIGVVPELNAQALFAYSQRLYEKNDGSFYLDLGVSTGLKIRVFSEQVSAKDFTSGDFSLDDVKFFGGWTIPINFSSTVGFLKGNLELSVAANNINIAKYVGAYGLNSFTGTKNLIGGIFGSGSEQIKWNTPFELNVSAVYNPHLKLINPVIRADFFDIIGYIRDDLAKGKKFAELFKHLNIQANIRLLEATNVLDAQVAYKFGYPEFGLSIGAYGSKIQVLYGWTDSSSNHGEKPVDYFSIRVNLGFDKN